MYDMVVGFAGPDSSRVLRCHHAEVPCRR